MGYDEYDEEFEFEEFYPLPEYNPEGIEFPAGYVDKHHLITDEEINEICESVGIKDLIIVPREGYGGGDFLKEIFIGLGINIFAAAIYDSVKAACLKLINKIKTNSKKDYFDFVFVVNNVEKGMRFEVRTNTEDNLEVAAELLDQAKRIVDIINEPIGSKE